MISGVWILLSHCSVFIWSLRKIQILLCYHYHYFPRVFKVLFKSVNHPSKSPVPLCHQFPPLLTLPPQQPLICSIPVILPFLDVIKGIIQYITFWVCLFLLSISAFKIHPYSVCRWSLLFIAELYPILWMCHDLVIRSPADGLCLKNFWRLW